MTTRPVMRGYLYGAQQLTDCPSDGWQAIKVFGDGVPIVIDGPFKTEEEAEDCADLAHQTDVMARA